MPFRLPQASGAGLVLGLGVAAGLVLGVVAATAVLVPARRATRVDP